ncbi:MAG: efflux RND transporter periplasmic adaptor subunit, partial [Bacteroidales bacterium]
KGATDPDSTFRLILPDNSEYGFNGTLTVIGRAVDPQTGTITIRVVFPNSQELLKPGMNCIVKVLNSNSGERVVIPYKAVVVQMSEYFVFKIDSGIVKQVRIEPGLTLGEYLEVKQGVKPGDEIVLDGVQKVYNGSRVQVGGSVYGQQPPVRK